VATPTAYSPASLMTDRSMWSCAWPLHASCDSLQQTSRPTQPTTLSGAGFTRPTQPLTLSGTAGNEYWPECRKISIVVIGATTAEKLEGTLRGVDADPLPCLPLFISRPPPIIAPPMFQPFSSLLFFPSTLKSSNEVWRSSVGFPQCTAKNDRQLQKLEGTKYTWSPLCPKFEGTRTTGRAVWLRLRLITRQSTTE